MRALRRLVGNTPLLAIRLTCRGVPRTVFATCEHLNMTGCMKDRMAHPVVIVMPDWMSKERQDLLAAFGARVELVSREEPSG